MDERKEKRKQIIRKCCCVFNIVAVVLVFALWIAMFAFGMAMRRA